MYIGQLKTFISVVQNKSFIRAAEKLYITQPAITHQMNALEKELDVKLFDKSHKHIELTPAGSYFYDCALNITEMVTSAVKETRRIDYDLNDTLNIQYITGLEQKVAPQCIKHYLSVNPTIKTKMKVIYPYYEEAIQLNNSNDLLFCFEDDVRGIKDVSFTPLVKAKFCCILFNKHPLANKEIIDPNDLIGQNLVFIPKEIQPNYFKDLYSALEKDVSHFTILMSTDVETTLAMPISHMAIVPLVDICAPSNSNYVSIPLKYDKLVNYGIAVRNKHTKTVSNFISMSLELFKSSQLTGSLAN